MKKEVRSTSILPQSFSFKLKKTLFAWEHSAFQYQNMLRGKMAFGPLRQAALKKVRAAKRQFKETLAQWNSLHWDLVRVAPA